MINEVYARRLEDAPSDTKCMNAGILSGKSATATLGMICVVQAIIVATADSTIK